MEFGSLLSLLMRDTKFSSRRIIWTILHSTDEYENILCLLISTERMTRTWLEQKT